MGPFRSTTWSTACLALSVATVTCGCSQNNQTKHSGAAVPVRVVHPKAGGLPLLTTQPGSVISFQSADLYAKVPGYLKNQKVDIGDSVQKGELLAEIDAPELVQAATEARAKLDRSHSQLALYEAELNNAQASLKARKLQVGALEAKLEAGRATMTLREKQLDRIRALVATNSLQAELADEAEEKLEAAQSDFRVKQHDIEVGKSDVDAARATVEQSNAAIANARVAIKVAEAALAKAETFVKYTKIISPYDGVVTRRSFFDGDFITAGAGSDNPPILSVHRVDLMRVVVQVPDRFVRWVHRGDPALFVADELPGQQFIGRVSRLARHEDPLTRLMRMEVDIENPQGLLYDGMYGRMTILLERHQPGVTVPSQCLTGTAEDKQRSAFVVRNGTAQEVDVQVSQDNGTLASIIKGLTPDDEVVAEHGPDLHDTAPVQVLGKFSWKNSADDKIPWADAASSAMDHKDDSQSAADPDEEAPAEITDPSPQPEQLRSA